MERHLDDEVGIHILMLAGPVYFRVKRGTAHNMIGAWCKRRDEMEELYKAYKEEWLAGEVKHDTKRPMSFAEFNQRNMYGTQAIILPSIEEAGLLGCAFALEHVLAISVSEDNLAHEEAQKLQLEMMRRSAKQQRKEDRFNSDENESEDDNGG